MASELILIRHGETAWNREKIFRGRADVPLSERGQRQADRLALALRHESIEAVYTSPLTRTRETADRLGRALGLQPKVDAGIIAIEFGAWSGCTDVEVAEKAPDLYRVWNTSPERVRFPDGECLAGVSERALRSVESAATAHEGTVAVVSHRVPLKLVVLGLLGLGPAHFWHVRLNTASVTRFANNDGRWVLYALNDVSHLQELGGQEIDF